MATSRQPMIVEAWSAARWWLLLPRPHPGGDAGTTGWHRIPLVGFGLVEDVGGHRWVTGLEAVGDLVDLARTDPHARYVHDTSWSACGCSSPAVEPVDTGFCSACAGVVDAGPAALADVVELPSRSGPGGGGG